MPRDFLGIALEAARRGAACGEVPVGAVLVQGDTILSIAHNLTETQCDPTAHAEMLVIREACQRLGAPRLPDCDIYVTLEPCPMCAAAISHARLRRLYFAAYDPKGGGVEHGARVFDQATCHHKPEVMGGLHARESEALLRGFFAQRRLV